MIDGVVAPFDHKLSAVEDVNVTVPPSQKVVTPLAVIDAVAGIGFTVTAILFEIAEEQVFSTTVTE